MIKGCDVSSYQGLAECHAAIRDGAQFACVKATEGHNYRNPLFRTQVELFMGNHLPVLAYHFIDSNVNAAIQAQHFLHEVRGYLGRVVLAVDHEKDGSGIVPSDQLVRDVIATIHRAHHRVGRYASEWIFQRGRVGADFRWVAKWGKQRPSEGWKLWQFTANGPENMDWNYYNGQDVEAFHKWWGFMSRVS